MSEQCQALRGAPAVVLLAIVLAAGMGAGMAVADGAASCQAAGWNMSRELTAFARPPQSVTAQASAANLPLLRADTLYALRLRAQGEVHFAEPPTRPGRAVTPMAGMARFTVPSPGVYRVTLDSPLWIDVVTAQGVLAPTTYTGWHDCSVFRKSVNYTLEAGQTVTLQFSDAATDLVKVTIEPAPAG
jgi:hypothetical protein